MDRDDQANDAATPPPAFDPEDVSPSDVSEDTFHRGWWKAQLVGVVSMVGFGILVALTAGLKRLKDQINTRRSAK